MSALNSLGKGSSNRSDSRSGGGIGMSTKNMGMDGMKDESMSPQNSTKGKLDIKSEDDIKKEMDDSESQSTMEMGGKNSESMKIKSEVKTEPMDMDDSTTVKEEVKDEPMSPSDVKSETKPAVPEPIVQPDSADKKKKCLFKSEELKRALLPTLEKLYRQDPESIPFRQPVDPNALGIPDYFDIVKTPMDLSTIQGRLNAGHYTDPWQYVDDVWMMFDNAWLYNRKTSRVYRYCTKVGWFKSFFSFKI